MEAGTTSTNLTENSEYEPTTAKEKQDRRNEMKARGILLMALLNKDQLKFHTLRRGSSLETMDETFDRLQKLITQLEIQGEVITQENMNLKLLRSLPSIWKNHALIWRNKQEIETINLDDLYTTLKIYEPELQGSSSTIQNPQNVVFVPPRTNSNCNINTNEADNTAYGVSAAHTQCNPTSGDNLSDAMICAFLASQLNSPQLAREDLEQIDPDDLEEMDLQWEMAMLTIRARRFIKRTGRKGRENSRRIVTMETLTENALVAQDRIGGYDWSYQAEEGILQTMPINGIYILRKFFQFDSEMLDIQECNKSKSDRGYHVVPPPYTGNFIPFKPDLTFMDEIIKSENIDVITIVTPSNVKKVESNHESANVKNNGDAVEPKTVRKNSFRPRVI
ncbi:hypothetical protein Tco_0841902 [Tanacetum coccineum]|uniref:Uncharacterized protein n=1 Tax=Tanacetum coccineum TaxID=301880 RepID=A0ABQ5AXR9_9ASTR